MGVRGIKSYDSGQVLLSKGDIRVQLESPLPGSVTQSHMKMPIVCRVMTVFAMILFMMESLNFQRRTVPHTMFSTFLTRTLSGRSPESSAKRGR